MTGESRRSRRALEGRRRPQRSAADSRVLRRKLSAVLAGGLVLGIGAVTTLAAWTDQEQAQGTFTSGIFKLESRTDAGAFADHTGTAAQLAFNAAEISPGSLHYAFLDVKTTTASTSSGTAKFLPGVVSADPSGLAVSLKLRATVIAASATCNAAAVSGVSQVAIDAVPAALSDKPLSAKGANTQRYCLEVGMVASTPSTLQGKSAMVTWTVSGTSDS